MKCLCGSLAGVPIEKLDEYLQVHMVLYDPQTIIDGVHGVSSAYHADLQVLLDSIADLQYLSLTAVRIDYLAYNMANIQVLELVSCRLEAFDAALAPCLRVLNLQKNMLKSVNLSGCTDLTYLNVQENLLQSLQTLSLSLLEQLICSSNDISGLLVEYCTHLRLLCCGDNLLQKLAVGPNLEYLECSGNLLYALCVPPQSMLKYLSAYDNYLAFLAPAPSIEYLDVSFNQFAYISTASMPQLRTLQIAGNAIKLIFVHACSKLEEFYVERTKTRREGAFLQLKYAVDLTNFYGKTDYFDYYGGENQLPPIPAPLHAMFEFKDAVQGRTERLKQLETRLRALLKLRSENAQ